MQGLNYSTVAKFVINNSYIAIIDISSQISSSHMLHYYYSSCMQGLNFSTVAKFVITSCIALKKLFIAAYSPFFQQLADRLADRSDNRLCRVYTLVTGRPTGWPTGRIVYTQLNAAVGNWRQTQANT
jgi:hypothetical protein